MRLLVLLILFSLIISLLPSCKTIEQKWTKDRVIKEVFNNEVCGKDKDCD